MKITFKLFLLCLFCLALSLVGRCENKDEISFIDITGDTGGSAMFRFCPQGKKIFSNDEDGMRIWDAETGEKLHKLPGLIFDKFSADGKIIFARHRDRTIRIVDSESGNELHKIHILEDWLADISSDDKKIATLGGDTVRIWDVESGQELRKLGGHVGNFGDVRFSPNGKQIVTSSGHEMRIWNAESGEELRKMEGRVVYFSLEGKRLITGYAKEDLTFQIWDVESGKELHKLGGYILGFSPNGKSFVMFSEGEFRLWDVELGRAIQKVESVFFRYSPNGEKLATWTRDGIWVLDAESGNVLCKLEGAWSYPRFSTDGKKIVADKKLEISQIWDADTGKELQTLKGAFPNFSPDGKKIVTAIDDRTSKTNIIPNIRVRIWTLE